MQKIRIGVLMGGKSLEKEVSFNSGRTICDHLDTTRYQAIPIFQKDSTLYLLPWHFLHRGKTTDFQNRLATESTRIAWDDLKKHIDLIYIAQHGCYAEDGILQGFLELLTIPYVGSGTLASALRMDKIIHKKLLQHAGIVIPRYIVVEPHEIDQFDNYKDIIIKKISDTGIKNNYVIKPSNEGSSIGISLIDSLDNLHAALKYACYIEPNKKKRVLIEEKINGMEFTCVTLVDPITQEYISLPPTEIIPEKGTSFFDYEQKYMPGRGIKRTPAQCNPETIANIQQTCIKVMKTLEFSTMSRIDGFVTDDGSIIIIDPNTLSGMGPSSFIFNQAAQAHMSPSQLISHLLETELFHYNLIENNREKEMIPLSAVPHKKIRVAVLCGGASQEKETSLDSGRNVFYKLSPHMYDPIAVFINSSLELFIITQAELVRNSTKEITELLDEKQKIQWNDLPTIADFVFNALHGGAGENGSVQGALEMLNMPYNGSSVLASALCINKHKTNEFLAIHGFDVPRNMFITQTEWLRNSGEIINAITQTLPMPLIVKPHDDGCSVLVHKVNNNDELIAAITTIIHEKNAVLIEEYINGMELTVGVIGNNTAQALPPSQAVSSNGILSIEEKFLPGAGENQTPAPLPPSAISFVQQTIENVYKTVQCKGYARIDCFYQSAQYSPTHKERVIILEINTLPGLTPATCLFHQAAEIGLHPMDFINKIITLGFEQHKNTSINIDAIKTVHKAL